jgi:hypothetical protein
VSPSNNPLEGLTLNPACGGSVRPTVGTLNNRLGSCGGTAGTSQAVAGPRADVLVSVNGGAPRDASIANGMRPRLRACANQGLSQDPSMQGRLTIVATIAANGEVQKADIATNAGLGGNVAQCMLRGVKNAQFDATGAVRTLTFTMIMQTKSP